MARSIFFTIAMLNATRGALADDIVKKIKLGMDTDYPPYATATEDGQLAGFAVDFARGMNSLCEDIDIELVEQDWSNCWSDSDGGRVGPAIQDGRIDGCVAYTHTLPRDSRAEFSDSMLDDTKSAGLLTLLDRDGNAMVSGMDDLKGKTLIDVEGWAPSAEGLKFITNKCTNEKYSDDVNIVVADAEDYPNTSANDAAMTMLRNGEGDAIFLMADQAAYYRACPEEPSWNCTLWEGFGEEYAYVQTGQFGHVKNGTTFALTKKGSGIRELLRPCMSAFMASMEYYKICSRHDVVDKCYKNEFFDEDTRYVPIYNKPTSEQYGDCSNGYCPCDALESDALSAIDNEEDRDGFPIWAISTIVAGFFVAVAILGVYKYKVYPRRKIRLDEEKSTKQAAELKQKVRRDSMNLESASQANTQENSC